MYLAKEGRYWAQPTLRPISALHCQINQTLDNGGPNNCTIYFSLATRLFPPSISQIFKHPRLVGGRFHHLICKVLISN